MNGNSIVASLYKVKGGKEVSLNDLSANAEITDRVYNLDYVMQTSSNYQNCRRFLRINWEKSFELQGKKASWKKDILDTKKKELYSLKKKIGFNTKESYAEAVEMGEETTQGGRDYIITVEEDIEQINALKTSAAKKKAPAKETTKKVTPPSLDDLMEQEGEDA
jgi:hypothetical protein